MVSEILLCVGVKLRVGKYDELIHQVDHYVCQNSVNDKVDAALYVQEAFNAMLLQ